MMDTLSAKLLAIISLGLATFFVGLIPSCFMNQRQWPLFLSSLLCFGGGVLFSTSIVHILPEAREQMLYYKQYSELIMCVGFFSLYLLDEITHFFYNDEEDSHSHGSVDNNLNRRHSSGEALRYNNYGSNSERYSLLVKQPPYNPTIYKARSESYLNFDDETPSQLCHVGHQEPCNSGGTIANIGLLLALSTHALLEGIVVGLAKTSSNVLLFLGAVASHKLVVGFCLGAELAANPRNTFCKKFLYIFVFTFGSLLGIVVGMLIYNLPKEATDTVIPILQTLAAGTLLYVTVSEILPRERARWHTQHSKKSAGIFQFLSFGSGFIGMTLMSMYLDFD